jgi:hypothetical protein
MKVTVITLYAGREAQHFSAVVEGKVGEEDFRKLAKRFDAKIEGEEGFDEDDARQIFKVEMETYSSTRSGTGMSLLALY